MTSLSVITLTRNRLDRLHALLERLLPQLAAEDEILIVDTGSTDGTRAHFASWAHPNVRFLAYEGGGSWAEIRNFAVAQVRGVMIAFLDDDCFPAPDWVARGKADLADADAVGGVARPHGIARWPAWWHPAMGWVVGLSGPGHAGPDAGRLHRPSTSNLWARAQVCRECPFQEMGGALEGHGGGNYEYGREDAQWWGGLRRAGYRTRFDARLAVGHAIDPARLDLAYLRERARRDGRSWAAREGTPEAIAPLAYEWWTQCAAAWGGVFVAEDGSRHAHWQLHHLMRRRHGAALRALAARFRSGGRAAAPLWAAAWTARAGRHWLGDRVKETLRRWAAPWLVSIPDRPTRRPIERLAVVAFACLGDLVILQSVLRGLQAAHPTLEIYVLGPPSASDVLGSLRRINLTSTPDGLDPASPSAREWLRKWLVDIAPDAIAAPYLRAPWGDTLTDVRRPLRPVFGFDRDYNLRRRWRLSRLAWRVHKNLRLHESDNLCRLFECMGLACRPEPARIEPPVVEAEAAVVRPRCVMLNPEAGYAQKEWTPEHWRALTHRILDETDWSVVIHASRGRAAFELEPNAPGTERVTCLRAAPLDELIATLARCDALVTVDAGPQHLAHALDLPSVTLYGPMDERRWADRWRRPIHRTVRACAWDLLPEERCGLPVNHQVALIRPDTVFDALKTVLDERPPPDARS